MRSVRAGAAAIASLILALLAFAVAQPAATATPEATPPSATQVLGWLNQQRTTNGLPALTLDAARSAGCAAHNSYMALNNSFGHGEDSSKPGYTAAGAEAGQLAVLSTAYWLPPQTGGSSYGDPFERAPFHLAVILNPGLTSVGIDQHSGYLCIARASISSDSPGGLAVYPGNNTRGWAPQESSSELPTTPEAVLGIGTDTGKHLYVWTTGTWSTHPALRVTAATLTDSSGGTVPLRWCDNPSCGWHVAYNSAILIPTTPLKPQTTYTAEVNVSTENGPLSKTWSFTTAGSSGGTATTYSGTACPVKAGLLDASIILARGGTVAVNCNLIGVKSVTLTAIRLDANGRPVHRFPPVHLSADIYGGVSVSYRRLLAGQIKLGRYRLLIVPNVGKAGAAAFRMTSG
jgi:hypothetical protein